MLLKFVDGTTNCKIWHLYLDRCYAELNVFKNNIT